MKKIKKRNIVCIVSHPDDEALGIGGTLLKHVNYGDEVNIVILSGGEDAKPISKKNIKRKNNAQKWSEFMGCKLYDILDLPDQKFDTVAKLDIIQTLERIFIKLMPDIAYIHHPGDINHDHQIASHAALTALRPMSSLNLKTEIRTFETPSSSEQAPYVGDYIFKPNFYVSIEKEWIKKKEALQIYKKELGIYPHPRSIKSIKGLAVKRGSESGYKLAEAFCIVRKFWN